MSGFEYAEEDDGSESVKHWNAYLDALEAHHERCVEARNRNPKAEVEALLASLKTEGGFTREVKWGK